MIVLLRKYLPALLVMLFFMGDVAAQKKLFIRIYPTGTSKVIKGFYSGHNDSAVIIQTSLHPDTIYYSGIQTIKTKRTTGNNILISAVSLGLAGTVAGLATHQDPPPPDANCQFCNILSTAFSTTPAEDAFAGFVLGAVAGTLVGTTIGLTKKKQILHIDGDFNHWKAIRNQLNDWPVYIPDSN